MRSLQKSSLELAELAVDGEEEEEDEEEEEEEEEEDDEVCGQSHMVSNRHTPVGKSQTSSLQTSFGTLDALIDRLIRSPAPSCPSCPSCLDTNKKKEKKKVQHSTTQSDRNTTTQSDNNTIRSNHRKMEATGEGKRKGEDEEIWKQLRIVSRFVQEASMNVSVMVDLVEEQIPFLLALHKVSTDLANLPPLPQRSPRSQAKGVCQSVEE